MTISYLEAHYPVGTSVQFTLFGLGIAGGWIDLEPGSIGEVIGYIPADKFQGCRLLINWGSDKIISVFASQIDFVNK